MPPQLKSQAPEDLVRAVQTIEDTADVGHRNLGIFTYGRNLARWAVLARIILQIEQTILDKGYRSQTQNAVMLNVGRGGAQALSWINELSTSDPVSGREFVFDAPLFAAASQALWAAVSYESFTSTFPLWHKNVVAADLVSANVVRFAGEDVDSRRVRAYLQGLKPAADREPQLELGEALEPAVKEKIGNIASNAAGDRSSFTYGNPTRLYGQLSQRYLELSQSLYRHEDFLLLGTYTVGQFRSFYSALLAVCAVHEHACFLRAQLTSQYPANSGVMVRRLERWVRLLSKISDLPEQIVADIVGDLVFGATKTLDLYVHPFVTLAEDHKLLGIVPHFPLKSRPDENILRVCSLLRPAFFDAITHAKEGRMREELKAGAYGGFKIRGPRTLPGGLPDIDLIVEDAPSSTVVLAELKWLRKAIRSVEHIGQEAAFLRGIGQLEKIAEFLRQNPLFLLERGDVSDDLSKFKNVYYVLVPRDYFVWVDPANGIPVIEYDAFSRVLSRSTNLAAGMEELLTFDWLPKEGSDFEIKYETFSVNSVSVETEVIYAKY